MVQCCTNCSMQRPTCLDCGQAGITGGATGQKAGEQACRAVQQASLAGQPLHSCKMLCTVWQARGLQQLLHTCKQPSSSSVQLILELLLLRDSDGALRGANSIVRLQQWGHA